MHWGIYEFCAVLSGVILVGAGAGLMEKDWKPKHRVWAVAGGVALAIYGFYVARQSSGTFEFPAAMFAIPIGLGGRALYRWYQKSAATSASPKGSLTQTAPSEASPAIPTMHSDGLMQRRPRLHSALAAAALAVTISACSSDPLALSCSDYLSKDAATQLNLAATWGAPNRDQVGPAEKFVAPTYQQQLVSYCGTHPDEKLSNIQMTIGR